MRSTRRGIIKRKQGENINNKAYERNIKQIKVRIRKIQIQSIEIEGGWRISLHITEKSLPVMVSTVTMQIGLICLDFIGTISSVDSNFSEKMFTVRDFVNAATIIFIISESADYNFSQPKVTH